MATENARRQAEQSRDMARLQEQVAEGTKQLVASEAESRREWIALKHDLQADLADVAQQRNALESERVAIAAQRQRDPIVAAALEAVGLTLACLVPLVVAALALRHGTVECADTSVAEDLIREMLRQRKSRLPAPQPARLRAPDNAPPT